MKEELVKWRSPQINSFKTLCTFTNYSNGHTLMSWEQIETNYQQFLTLSAAFYDLQVGGPHRLSIAIRYTRKVAFKCIILINLHKWNDDKQFSFVVLEVFFFSISFLLLLKCCVVVSDRWMLTAKRSMNRVVFCWCSVLLDIGNELWFYFAFFTITPLHLFR